MQELIREYGKVIVSVLAGMLAVGIVAYACVCIAAYMGYVADSLMGGV